MKAQRSRPPVSSSTVSSPHPRRKGLPHLTEDPARAAEVVDVWFNKSGGKTWIIRARNGDIVIVHGG